MGRFSSDDDDKLDNLIQELISDSDFLKNDIDAEIDTLRALVAAGVKEAKPLLARAKYMMERAQEMNEELERGDIWGEEEAKEKQEEIRDDEKDLAAFQKKVKAVQDKAIKEQRTRISRTLLDTLARATKLAKKYGKSGLKARENESLRGSLQNLIEMLRNAPNLDL